MLNNEVHLGSLSFLYQMRSQNSAPTFSMRWTLDQWKTAIGPDPSDLPVVLIGESSHVYAIMEAVSEEKICVGIDVVPGPNAGMHVVCICVSGAVFALESSLLRPIDVTIVLTFLSGLQIPLVSLRDNLFDGIFSGSAPSVKRVDNPDRRRTRSPDLSRISENAEALAIHFGLTSFLARQVSIQARRQPEIPSASDVYKKLAMNQPQKRQRTLVAPAAPAPLPRRSEPKPLDGPTPPPLFTEDVRGDLEPEPEDNMDSKDLTDTEISILGAENAKRYMQWFQ